MIQELLIKLRTAYEGSGFSRARSDMSSLQSKTASVSSNMSTLGSTGTWSLNSIGTSASGASSKLTTTGTAGKNAGTSISKGMSTAISSAEALTSTLTGVVAGFGLIEIASSAVSGAMGREFNEAYLTMKLGSDQAGAMAEQIQNIVASVPGDDTFMNTLLGTAAARGAAIEDLRTLGNVAADYLVASQMTGMNSIEAQQDLNSYIMTGNTGELERSRVLAGQVDTLKGKESIHDRILALDQALKANGYEGLSQMDIMNIKWETLKGKIQLALTDIGSQLLPYLEAAVDWLLDLDDKTGGWSSKIIVISGTILLIVGSLGLIAGPIKTGIQLFRDMYNAAKDVVSKIAEFILPSTKTVKVNCVKDSSCNTSSTGTVTSSAGTAAGTAGTAATAGGISTLALTGSLTIVGAGLLVATILQAELYNSLKDQPEPIRDVFGVGTGTVFDPSGEFWLKMAQNPLGVFGGGTDALNNLNPLGSLMDLLLPGAASAAGSGDKSQTRLEKMWSDVTGKGGLLDFSRFGLKWPDISLQNILDLISPMIPFLKWKIPTWSQLVSMISGFIAWLGWKIPTWSQLVSMISGFIAWLGWNVPSVSNLVSMISGFIGYLRWSIPSAQSILNAIVSHMLGGAAGDEGSMLEAAGLVKMEPYTITNSVTGETTVVHSTISPTIKIESINSRDDADYFVQKVVNELSDLNDRKGR